MIQRGRYHYHSCLQGRKLGTENFITSPKVTQLVGGGAFIYIEIYGVWLLYKHFLNWYSSEGKFSRKEETNPLKSHSRNNQISRPGLVNLSDSNTA